MMAPGRPVAPASLRARLLPPRVRLPCLLPPISSLRPTAAAASRAASSATARRRITAGVVLLHCNAIAQFVLRSAPPRLPPSRARALAMVCAQGKAQSSVSSTTAPWPPLTVTRGRSPLRPLSLLCLKHQHRLHLAELARALLAATAACSGRPPCANAAVPPCMPTSSMSSSSGRVLGTTGFASSRGVGW
jgi:hypothetical protein